MKDEKIKLHALVTSEAEFSPDEEKLILELSKADCTLSEAQAVEAKELLRRFRHGLPKVTPGFYADDHIPSAWLHWDLAVQFEDFDGNCGCINIPRA